MFVFPISNILPSRIQAVGSHFSVAVPVISGRLYLLSGWMESGILLKTFFALLLSDQRHKLLPLTFMA